VPTKVTVRRRDVLRFRFGRQQLDRPEGTARSRLPDIVDYGVQDTGPDGSGWALTIRGAPGRRDELILAWSLRGAPHAYRRRDFEAIAVATAPYSEDDAAKRVFDASTPLRAAGIPVLDAMRTVAEQQRRITVKAMVKGEVSRRLAEQLDAPFLRECRRCEATHVYENMFRLPALQGGLALDWDTSPPVLRRLAGVKPSLFSTLATEAPAHVDVIRNHLRFYPASRVRDAATFLEAPIKVVEAHWPGDAVEVAVRDDPTPGKSEPRFALDADLDSLRSDGCAPALRLLGPFDAYLQLRDRELLVEDEAQRKDLWRVLGRPGAIVVDGEVIGTWRPRSSGKRLTILTEPWRSVTRRTRQDVAEQAERLADHRGVELVAVDG
jgi:hypothetical protein